MLPARRMRRRQVARARQACEATTTFDGRPWCAPSRHLFVALSDETKWNVMRRLGRETPIFTRTSACGDGPSCRRFERQPATVHSLRLLGLAPRRVILPGATAP